MLDANYEAGEKLSEIQSRLGGNCLNSSKECGPKCFTPVSKTVESATALIGEMFRSYREMDVAVRGASSAGNLRELEERIEKIGGEARLAARRYDELLAEDPIGALNYAQKLRNVTSKLEDGFAASSQVCKTQNPKDACSLHDFLRYLHENAIGFMFENAHTKSIMERSDIGKTAIIVDDTNTIFVDLDGHSTSRYQKDQYENLRMKSEDVTSAPLKAMVKLKGNKDYAAPSIRAIAARDFVDAQMYLGDHEATVESCIKEDNATSADNNYITLKYLELGVYSKKDHGHASRIDYMAGLLNRLGFQCVTVPTDKSMVKAQAKGYTPDTTAKKLTELTRLLVSSKQLDLFFGRPELENDEALSKELLEFAMTSFLDGETAINAVLNERYAEVKLQEKR